MTKRKTLTTHGLAALVLALGLACGDEDDGAFPDYDGAPPGDDGGMDGGMDGGTGGDGTGGGTDGGGDGGTGDGGMDGGTGDGGTGDGGTGDGGTGDGGTGTGTGGPPVECPPAMGNRPAMGAWSCCSMDNNTCAAPNTLCSYIDTTGLGFCTKTGCMDPATDCDPAPAGSTVTPVCYPVNVNGMDEQACGLDCTMGNCPDGMMCYAVGMPAMNLCF